MDSNRLRECLPAVTAGFREVPSLNADGMLGLTVDGVPGGLQVLRGHEGSRGSRMTQSESRSAV